VVLQQSRKQRSRRRQPANLIVFIDPTQEEHADAKYELHPELFEKHLIVGAGLDNSKAEQL
jgi:hypothetical protein